MSRNGIGIPLLLSVCACVVLSGCTGGGGDAPEVAFISAEQAAELWQTAEERVPLGEPAVEVFTDDYGTTVLCRQAFRLGSPGRGPVTLERCCTGRCTLTPGSGFDDCKTSGCDPTADGCTALSCSGGCTLSQTCRPCSGPVLAVGFRPA